MGGVSSVHPGDENTVYVPVAGAGGGLRCITCDIIPMSLNDVVSEDVLYTFPDYDGREWNQYVFPALNIALATKDFHQLRKACTNVSKKSRFIYSIFDPQYIVNRRSRNNQLCIKLERKPRDHYPQHGYYEEFRPKEAKNENINNVVSVYDSLTGFVNDNQNKIIEELNPPHRKSKDYSIDPDYNVLKGSRVKTFGGAEKDRKVKHGHWYRQTANNKYNDPHSNGAATKMQAVMRSYSAKKRIRQERAYKVGKKQHELHTEIYNTQY